MKHTYISILFIVWICLLPAREAAAQVNPGDADNNGVVDNHDILYIGYAFGATGPRRVETEASADSILPVSLYWAEHFPTGQNYIFADTDGNGLVEWEDFLTVYDRYGVQYNELRTTDYPAGDPDTSPPLELRIPAGAEAYTEGSRIELPLVLGATDRPVNELQGLAFSVRFDSTLIRAVRLEIDSASWLMADRGAFPFQTIAPGRGGRLDVAVTRLGRDPVSGFGTVGTLSIIIEDDLIDFRPFEKDSIHTYIHLDLIELRNVEFDPVLVTTRPLKLTLVNPGLISGLEPAPENRLAVYPNPVTGWLRIDADAPIHNLEIWDCRGQMLFRTPGRREPSLYCTLPDLPPGLLILAVRTERGLVVRKIVYLSYQ